MQSVRHYPAVVELSESEGAVVERRAELSGWRDPRLYVAILSLLLVLILWLATRLSAQLDTINAGVQAIAIASGKQTVEIAALQRQYDKLDARVTTDETNQNAYNNQQAILLTQINTKLNLTTDKGK